jgi:S1-C subfamily serine protease
MRSTRRCALALAALIALFICTTTTPSRAASPSAFLGAALAASPPGLAGRGIWVRAIAPDSPAERAGLQANDTVVMVDGNRVSDPAAMQNYIDSKNPGDTLTFDVMRWNGGGWSPCSSARR